MPDLVHRSVTNPDFARIVTVARLRGLREFAFDVAPTPEEAAALARLMGARSVRRMRFAGRLSGEPDGAWRLDGQLGATVTQSCVVTLDPVTTRIDAPVRRRFDPGLPAEGPEIVLVDDEDDETEPLGATIDLGLIATEALALALPAYPRSDGATLGSLATSAPQGAAPIVDAEVRPFAALAALRGKSGEGA